MRPRAFARSLTAARAGTPPTYLNARSSPMSASAAWASLPHALEDRAATLLEVAEREPLDLGRHEERRLHRVDVDGRPRGVHPELAHQPLTVRLEEVRVHVRDLAEEVEVGRERGRRRV